MRWRPIRTQSPASSGNTIPWILMLAVIMPGPQHAGALEMVLTVREPAGVAREAQPCAGGIPLAPGALTDVGRLRVLDPDGKPVPAQFRVINRRPTGDVEWLHVAFPASVPPGASASYRLDDRGPSPLSASPLLRDGDDAITIVTGPLKCRLPKDRLAGLGEVWLDRDGNGQFSDDEIASTGGALTILGMDGKRYRSTSDLAGLMSLAVEESGPLFATVRAEGTMKLQSADGGEHFYPTYDSEKRVVDPQGVRLSNRDGTIGFTVRLQFWKGQPWIRALVTMRNLAGWTLGWTERKIQFGAYFADSCQKPGNWLVDAVNFDVDLRLDRPPAYRVAGGIEGSEIHKGELAANGRGVVLYQDSSSGWMWQAGMGRVFDDRLARNIAFMKEQARRTAVEKGEDPDAAAAAALPYYEYVAYVFEELLQKRDGGSFMGYRLFTDAVDVPAGTTSSFADLAAPAGEGMRAPGWIEVDDGRIAVTAGCRWFWQMFPKSLELRPPGRLTIGLWSQYLPRGHLFEGTVHKTHELFFDFRPSGSGPAPAERFRTWTQRLIPAVDARHNLISRAYGDFMLPNPEDWPMFEKSALSAVACCLDESKNPGWASCLEIEREKYDVYGIWKFGDSVKGGWHYFGQYQELDVPYCLMVHYARTGDRRFLDEAEKAVRFLLDVPAHGGGYGHQKGESSHYYVYGPLLYANADGAPFLREAIRHAHETTEIRPWHLRSFAVQMWANWALYHGFEDLRPAARQAMNEALAWWKKNQKPSGEMGGMSRTSQVFFLGMGGDALGRYCESFPDETEWREALVLAMREWKTHLESLSEDQRKPLLDKTCANAFAYASRFSGDPSFLRFAAEHLVRDDRFTTHYRTGVSSAKNWSETMGAHRLIQVFLHDVDRERHPERYAAVELAPAKAK